MGTKHSYQCNTCNYSTQVSGTKDFGFTLQTDTYLCSSCQEIVDVVIEYFIPTQIKDNAVGKCPVCHRSEYLKTWQDKACPKCNATMTLADEEDRNDILWD